MSAADTRPTQPLPDAGSPGGGRGTRRRAWPWVVGFGIVAVLAVAAWFAGEAIARQVVEGVVRDQVKTQLSLPADQQLDVAVTGTVLPQLIGGTLTELTITSDDVPLGAEGPGPGVTGDVSVSAWGVPVRGGEFDGAEGTLVLDEQQLRDLMSNVEGFPAETLGLAEPDITMSVDLTLFGATLPVDAALTPSTADGELVLTPASLQIGGAEVSAVDLRDRFGDVADDVLCEWDVCVAEHLPAGIALTAVAVEHETLVAGFDVDGGITSDPALQENGTCA